MGARKFVKQTSANNQTLFAQKMEVQKVFERERLKEVKVKSQINF